MYFKDRIEAGEALAEKLEKYKNSRDVIILAIPRGGVQTAHPIARALKVKLDIIVTKKIPMPGNEEAAIGAVGPKGYVNLDKAFIESYGIPDSYIEEEKKELQQEIQRRYEAYRGTKALPDLKDKIVILVDDGIATGYTTRTAIDYIMSQKPRKLILAVPVAPKESIPGFEKMVDEVVCIHPAEFLMAISQFYASFPQLDDEDVKRYLKNA